MSEDKPAADSNPGIGKGGLFARVSAWLAAASGWRVLLAGVALLLLVLAALYPLLKAEFILWDETEYIINNPHIREFSFDNFFKVFAKTDLALYTPLTTYSFTFDYALGRLNPAVYHAVNLALHMGNTLLVFALGGLLGLPFAGAFFMAALFGVHPMHVESVGWVAERKDVLYSFFYLSSIIAYIKSRAENGARLYWLSLAFFVLAVLAKPMAITLPFILMLCEWYLADSKAVIAGLKNKIPYLAVTAGFVAYLALPKFLDSASGGHGAGFKVLSQALIVPPYAWMFYISKLLLPVNLSGMYNPDPGWAHLTAYIVGAELLAIGTFIPLFVFRNKPGLFGLTFFTVSLLPVIQIIKFGPVLVADRYTYLPALGLFFIAAYLLCKGLDRLAGPARSGLMAFAAALVCALVMGSNLRARVWRDPVTFWQDALTKNDVSKSVKVNLANAYMRLGRYKLARPLLEKVLRQDSGRASALINYGICMLKAGDTDQALDYFERARREKPHKGDVYANIASVYYIKRDYQQVFSNMDEAIRLRPGRNPFHYNYAFYLYKAEVEGVCRERNCRAEAERHLLSFLSTEPESRSGQRLLCQYVYTPEQAARQPLCAAVKAGAVQDPDTAD